MSLKYKMIFNHTVLLLFFIIVLIFMSNLIFKKEFNNYIIKNHNEASKKIVEEVLVLYQRDGEPTYDELFNIGIKALDNGMVLMVNETYNKQLICMSDIFPTDSLNMLEQMEKTMKSIYPHHKGEYREDIYNLSDGRNTYGYVTLGYYGPVYYSEFDATFLKSFNRAIYFIGIVFFLVTSIFIYFIADKISRPISFVSQKAREIEQGNYNDSIDINSTTLEINNLINSVNSLSKNLNNQQKIKKQMAQNYTHEIRTPLTSVMTTLEGMQEGVFKVTSQRIDTLYSEIQRIISLIENVDKLVETSSNDYILEKTNFDLKDNIDKILNSFEAMFQNKNISSSFNFDKSSNYNIYADEEKINSVIYNLVSNACKYSDVDGKVIVNLSKTKDNYIIKVIDNGIGIENNEKDLIFEHLYRVDKSRVKETEGYGIGLSICKNIINAHKGTIEVNSNVNVGSEFIVNLPIRRI